MKLAGQKVEMVVFCGGLAKNKLYVQTHADVLGWYPCQCTADVFLAFLIDYIILCVSVLLAQHVRLLCQSTYYTLLQP